MQTSSAHAADTDYLVPYIGYIIARKGKGSLSLNKILRTTWVGGLGGAAVAGSGSYVRYAYSSEDSVRMKRIETTYNTDVLRRNDHSTIGGILAAVLTPAILWKRASAINLILGGAGVGSGVGMISHYFRSLAGDPPPKVEINLTTTPH
ncbi:hypothetical protein NLJ89_g1420 [Agrocybe chaxingu]|uniref:Uncharacterized protein n=1 Tax=Agrocybe chaxingu TaxID=84603 RepID=A0A9W8TEE8_9AGAR|nr:hypothetical protein NLJ89_g1420 [Agrocybe chaxingu]